MNTPIICRTYRLPANQCKCFRCNPLEAKTSRQAIKAPGPSATALCK